MSSDYPEYCQNGKYERKSFDRFGDDFCELILSYLEINDKIRLQFVNSQWRRCIFNKVYEFDYPLELNDFGIKVSKKPNIQMDKHFFEFNSEEPFSQ